MTKLTNEQIESILEGAPDWAKHYTKKPQKCILEIPVDTHKISDLREILSLRQEVEIMRDAMGKALSHDSMSYLLRAESKEQDHDNNS